MSNIGYLFSPMNSSNKIILTHTFTSPLHYLYYYIYAHDKDQQYNILNSNDVDSLLVKGYQLQQYICNEYMVKSYLYTLFTYLYMFNDEVKQYMQDKDILLQQLPYYKIPNDEHLTYLYNRTIRLFIKNIVIS